tara:strand:+ start:597 stop:1076 length:480 start_codon:yes stop_codon:yes gene_type:complete
MPIQTSDNISNESGNQYAKSQSTTKLEEIRERLDDTTDNDNPYDTTIQYFNKKIDECVGVVNTNDTKVTFPGIGTTSSKCKAGDTTTISDTQANAITTNTSKVTFPFTGLKSEGGTSIMAITHQLNKENKSHELLLTVIIPPVKKGTAATTKTVTLQLK